MNRTPWQRRREPLDHVELARLLPAPGDPELPRGRLTRLEEHLMSEIQQHAGRQAGQSDERRSGIHAQSAPLVPPVPLEPPRRTRRRGALIAAAAAVAVLAGAVGAGQIIGGHRAGPGGASAVEANVPAPVVQVRPGTTHGLRLAMDRISLAAGQEKPAQPGPGQFIYIKSQVSWLSIEENVDANEHRTWVQKLHPREVWLSPDGRKGWLIEMGNGNTSKEGMDLDSDVKPYLSAPSYDYLKTLPTDPDALLKKIYRETAGHGDSPDQEAFTTIGDLVREQLMTPELTSALYRAAAKIPGVVLVDEAKDAVGRSGIAIARVDEKLAERTEWIFDKKSFTYLGERTVQIREADGIKAGTVTARTAVTERSVVDEMKLLPGTGTA